MDYQLKEIEIQKGREIDGKKKSEKFRELNKWLSNPQKNIKKLYRLYNLGNLGLLVKREKEKQSKKNKRKNFDN